MVQVVTDSVPAYFRSTKGELVNERHASISDARSNTKLSARSAQKGSPAMSLDPSTPDTDPFGLADLGTPADQISGLYTMAIVDSLEKRLSASQFRDFLARAGETRSVEELRDLASWNLLRSVQTIAPGGLPCVGLALSTAKR